MSLRLPPWMVALDMSVSVETAEIEWYEQETCTNPRKVAAYRERYEKLRDREEKGITGPLAAVTYVPDPDADECETDAELRFPGQASPFTAPPMPAHADRLSPPPSKPVRASARPPQPQPAMNLTNTPPSDLGHRLTLARDQCGWDFYGSARVIAERIGRTKGQIHQAMGGHTRGGVPEIARFLHVAEAWLVTGQGEMFTGEPPQPPADATRRAKAPTLKPVATRRSPAPPTPLTPTMQATLANHGIERNGGAHQPEEKPMLSLRPRAIVEAARIVEIALAVHRCAANGKPVPVEWAGELVELTERQAEKAAA